MRLRRGRTHRAVRLPAAAGVSDGAISLIRGDDMVDARAPAYKPRVIDSSYTQIKPQDKEGYGQGGADDDDIPF